MPTKEEFEAYVRVQQSGVYNMITDAPLAAEAAGLTFKTYMDVVENYSELAMLYHK